MIPRIQTGKSFKGALLYYMHDKGVDENGHRLTTSNRVAWTHTLNCLNDDPALAEKEMQHTCMIQKYLRKASGNRTDGRPIEDPVITVALSWPPDMYPTSEEMIEGAKDYLQSMGWHEHQAILIAHNDTKHKHVHLTINKVHPETGMAADMAWYKNRSQDWGLRFERQQGHIYCLKRLENERDRYRNNGEVRPQEKKRGFAHYGEWRIANQEMNREGVFNPENAELATSAEWASLKNEQREERIAFWNQSKRLFRQVHKEAMATVKEEFAERWQEHYKLAAETKLAIKERQAETRRLSTYYRRQARTGTDRPSHFERVRRYLRWGARSQTGPSPIEGVNKTRASQDDLATKRLSAIRAARSQIKRAMREEYVRVSEHAIYLLKQDRDKEYQALLARQRGDKHDLKQDQAERRRRYDLLANYGKASANDNRENGKDREAANNNRPAFEMTSQIVRAINRRELDRVDVSKYIAQARRAYHVNQAISANPKHPDAHELDDASRRAIASINTALHKRRAEEKRRRILAAQPPVRGAIRKAALELRSRGRGKENQREGQQEKQTSKDVPVNVLVRRAWEAIQRERERSDLQQGRTAHGGPGETRDRGGGMER